MCRQVEADNIEALGCQRLDQASHEGGTAHSAMDKDHRAARRPTCRTVKSVSLKGPGGAANQERHALVEMFLRAP
jgi:hypothetical protein